MYQKRPNAVAAVKVAASTFGVYGGLLGLEHGIGEILQGNIAVASTRIDAYAIALPFPFGHEPAMTLLPTYLMTGIFAILVAIAVMIWSTFFIAKKFGAPILILLSALLLIVGGGYGTISMLILSALAGLEARSSFKLLQRLQIGLRQLLARFWPWLAFVVFLIVAASIAGGYLAGMNDPSFNPETLDRMAIGSGLLQVCFAFLAIVAATMRDSLRKNEGT